jgi:tetratricopeptide (TPR) repeat protein
VAWWLAWYPAAAWACGPELPPELLRDRGVSLQELPPGMFFDQAGLLAEATAQPLPDVALTREEAEQVGLSAEEIALVKAMRAQPSYDAAWAAGEGLAPELRLYTAGAVAWQAGDNERAVAAFADLIGLPEAERPRRSTWGWYMVAEAVSGLRGARDVADMDYEVVRTLARAGFADPWGLALDSLGEQARMHLDAGDVVRAVHLYREQAVSDHSARVSLLFVARQLVSSPEQLELALRDEQSRELLALYLYTRSGEIADPAALAEQLERAAPGTGAWPGMAELAAASYQLGRYDQAERLAARADTALAHWVRGKLLLRAGDLERAAASYAAAVSRLSGAEGTGLIEGHIGEQWAYQPVAMGARLAGESGLLSLARGEYTQALTLLLQQGALYWADASYVAERVLTADELAPLVDQQPPEAPMTEALRALLGRRLVREGRADEAVPYLTPLQSDPAAEAASWASAYGQHLQAAQRPLGGSVARAQAWFEAGRLARLHGLEIMGYEGDPDFASYGGQYDPHIVWSESGEGRYGFDVAGPYTTEEELRRAEQHKARPDRRFHYREVAADHAERAADLLPPGSQAYAMVLCHASRWVATRNEPRHRALWQRYVENGAFGLWWGNYMEPCAEPDWEAARQQVQARWRQRAWVGLGAGLAGLLGLLGLWRWSRGR